MELFSEIKNSTIREITIALNQYTNDGNPIKRFDLKNRVCKNDDLSPAEETLIDQLFIEDDSNYGYIIPKINHPFPVLPTTIELQWLTDILNDCKICLLLNPDTKAKLQDVLSNYQPSPNIWDQKSWNYAPLPKHDYYYNPTYIDTFKRCYESIINKKQIYYESCDTFGTQHKGVASPYKLEYCVLTNSFNFIMWDESKNGLFKSDINNIKKIDILNDSVEANLYEKTSAYIQSMRETTAPIKIKIQDKYNSLVRCFLMFTSYEKDFYEKDDDGSFTLDIFYRKDFDEDDILQAILSLGSAVTVISPPEFRLKVIESIKQSFTR